MKQRTTRSGAKRKRRTLLLLIIAVAVIILVLWAMCLLAPTLPAPWCGYSSGGGLAGGGDLDGDGCGSCPDGSPCDCPDISGSCPDCPRPCGMYSGTCGGDCAEGYECVYVPPGFFPEFVSPCICIEEDIDDAYDSCYWAADKYGDYSCGGFCPDSSGCDVFANEQGVTVCGCRDYPESWAEYPLEIL